MSLWRNNDARFLFDTFQGGALKSRAECANDGLNLASTIC